jgi:ribonuclease E
MAEPKEQSSGEQPKKRRTRSTRAKTTKTTKPTGKKRVARTAPAAEAPPVPAEEPGLFTAEETAPQESQESAIAPPPEESPVIMDFAESAAVAVDQGPVMALTPPQESDWSIEPGSPEADEPAFDEGLPGERKLNEAAPAAEVVAEAGEPPLPGAPSEERSAAQQGSGENGERRRRRRRGRRGRGRGRRQEGELANGEQAAAPTQQRQPSKPDTAQRQPHQQPSRHAPQPQHASPPPRHGPQGDRRSAQPPRPAPAPQRQNGRPRAQPDAELVPEPTGAGDRVMLINVAEGEECRIAILHQGRLEELFIERASTGSHVGNIYKGRVTNVEPSIQAAFIDFGLPKNGFLHISDLQPQYFPDGMKQVEEVGRKTPRRERPPIQKCLRRGQEVLVQIIKEGIGSKGPTLTTYISIPGRYLVMLPGMNRLGVSRKIEDDDVRRQMRRILDELELPRDMGFILRTAGIDRNKRDLQRDLQYLQRLWKVVAARIKNERAPCELYQESDLVIRTVRDVYSGDFGKIIVDDESTAEKIRDFLSIVMPRGSAPVEVYKGPEPIFHKYGMEAEIERINARHVPLPSGGSLVIDSTEALVAIDVNSGRYRDLDDAEETAYRINLEAAEEIARQLRLRDLGGLIVCDFIDMRMEKHRRAVERALRDALKKHKERAKCLRMSQFGIIEMTRQRMRPSIKRSIYQDCPHCRGAGLVKNPESMTLDIMRLLRLTTHQDQAQTVEVRVSPMVAFQLQNRKRATIHAMEQTTGRRVIIRPDGNLGMDQYVFECFDARGGTLQVIEPPVEPKSPRELYAKRSEKSASDARSEAREAFDEVFE